MSSQERRLLRRMEFRSGQGTTPGGLYPQDEQDARRDRLAEQVLLEMVQYVEWADHPEGAGALRASAEEALRIAAHAAIAAAEVIYPEVPETGGVGSRPLPASAQAGAESVGGFPVEPVPIPLGRGPSGERPIRGEG